MRGLLDDLATRWSRERAAHSRCRGPIGAKTDGRVKIIKLLLSGFDTLDWTPKQLILEFSGSNMAGYSWNWARRRGDPNERPGSRCAQLKIGRSLPYPLAMVLQLPPASSNRACRRRWRNRRPARCGSTQSSTRLPA